MGYEANEQYKLHHDFIPFHVERQPGPRVLTLLLYLNEDELEGGETGFSFNDLKVSPKKGRGLLWHNVELDDPNVRDVRTHHEALPVLSGIKYAANAWIHLREFKSSFENGCV